MLAILVSENSAVGLLEAGLFDQARALSEQLQEDEGEIGGSKYVHQDFRQHSSEKHS